MVDEDEVDGRVHSMLEQSGVNTKNRKEKLEDGQGL